jgi:hypothetical protein
LISAFASPRNCGARTNARFLTLALGYARSHHTGRARRRKPRLSWKRCRTRRLIRCMQHFAARPLKLERYGHGRGHCKAWAEEERHGDFRQRHPGLSERPMTVHSTRLVSAARTADKVALMPDNHLGPDRCRHRLRKQRRASRHAWLQTEQSG